MCGRYLFSDAEAEDIRDIIRDVESRHGSGSVKIGEIYPSDRAPILLGTEQNAIRPELMAWGFPGFNNKGIVINSRSESAGDKPMFKKSLLTKRCVIPSSGFYEWTHDRTAAQSELPVAPAESVPLNSDLIALEDGQMALDLGHSEVIRPARKAKQKYLFRLPQEKVLYMAGLYGEFAGELRFVILTTSANASVADVHDRMPLILRSSLIEPWLRDTDRAMELLHESPLLKKTAV